MLAIDNISPELLIDYAWDSALEGDKKSFEVYWVAHLLINSDPITIRAQKEHHPGYPWEKVKGVLNG